VADISFGEWLAIVCALLIICGLTYGMLRDLGRGEPGIPRRLIRWAKDVVDALFGLG
jgi:hypothetical protein